MRAIVAVVLLSASVVCAQQPEEQAPRTLTPGKGVELTTARCVICHDATHITRTKLSRGEWEFNIKNMIERGAPITPSEIAPILEYLSTYYNRDVAPPASPAAAAAGGKTDAITNLLTVNACVACHQTDKKLVGPSFKEVAARYANDTAANARLEKKIREGGSGAWGTTPMPANAGLAGSDLQQLVSWILQQK